MAQEYKATMTCAVLAELSAFRLSQRRSNVSLKAAWRHRPIAIDPEGVTVSRSLFHRE
jgi:hypothetical protein